MPDILVSINRPHTDNIRTGFKTIELRKSAPKPYPFKAYIYETRNHEGCGAVIGEFTVNHVTWLQRRNPRTNTTTRSVIAPDLLWDCARITYKEFSDMQNRLTVNIQTFAPGR